MKELIWSLLEPVWWLVVLAIKFVVWYFLTSLDQPVKIWYWLVFSWVTIYVVVWVLNILLAALASLMCQSVENAELYGRLQRFRRGRDYLDYAFEALIYEAAYTRLMPVGKGMLIPQYVPARYPDPLNAKQVLRVALADLGEARFQTAEVKRVVALLPDVNDIVKFEGREVNNRTFAVHRHHIFNLMGEVKRELKEIERQLPQALIRLEKLLGWVRTTWVVVLWGIGLLAIFTVCYQGILLGLAYLVQHSAQ